MAVVQEKYVDGGRVVWIDRTAELHALVMESRAARPPAPAVFSPPCGISDSMGKAREVAYGLKRCAENIECLSQVVRNPQESMEANHQEVVCDLTKRIAQNLQELTSDIDELRHMRASSQGQGGEHWKHIVGGVSREVRVSSRRFRTVLDERKQIVETDLKRRARLDVTDPGVVDFDGSSVGTAMQDAQLDVRSSRREALVEIERSMTQLSELFNRFSQIVTEQEDQILRIDVNTEDALDNVVQAQTELLKYLGSLTGSRWLVFKIFSVIFLFVIIFGVFFVK